MNVSIRAAHWAILDQIFISGVSFVGAVLIARMLSIQDYATYALLAQATIFLLGLHRAFFTQTFEIQYSNTTDAKRWHQYLSLERSQWSSIIAISLMTIAMSTWMRLGIIISILVFVYSLACMSLDLLRRYLYCSQRIADAARLSATANFIQLGALILLPFATHVDLLTLMLVVTVIPLGTTVLARVILDRTTGAETEAQAQPQSSEGKIAESWRMSKWLVATHLAYWASTQVYPFFLAHFSGAEPVALYAASNAIMNVLNLLRLVVGNYLPARASLVYARAGARALRIYLQRVLLIAGAVTLIVSVLVAIFADFFVRQIYGEKLIGVAQILPVSAFIHGVVIMNVVAGIGANVLGRTHTTFWLTLGGATFSLTAGAALVESYGLWGAIIGGGVASIIPTLLQTLSTFRHCIRLEAIESQENSSMKKDM